MPLFIMGFMLIVGVAAVGGLKLWYETIRLRVEVERLRQTQNELIDMVSTKMLEDDALSREILNLKTGQRRP
jgi:hypothetical protein